MTDDICITVHGVLLIQVEKITNREVVKLGHPLQCSNVFRVLGHQPAIAMINTDVRVHSSGEGGGISSAPCILKYGLFPSKNLKLM